MTLPDYLERQEGPDGQHCDLLTRVPYDRLRQIELGLSFARTPNDEMDVVFRALLWTDFEKPRVQHDLTREWTDDVTKASAAVIQPWRKRAVELYTAWHKDAFPGPKDSTGKPGNRTRNGPKTA